MAARAKVVDHLAAFQLALETGLTTYDASYLLLARSLKISLVELQRAQGWTLWPGAFPI